MLDLIKQPWPWYVAGPLLGLTVPLLLLLGNKHLGISANLRHICAACFPSGISFFKYEYKKEIWNFLFILGVLMGGFIAAKLLANPTEIIVSENLKSELATYGITDYSNIIPNDIFSWEKLLTVKGFLLLVLGGFLVGFGTRYAGGCTSGHAISGLSNLQWPSLVATVCFMVGGILVANFVLPLFF
jgi:uncharacterized membrane protein YedE/YeeE